MEDLHSLESSLVLSSCLLPGSFCGHLFLNPISLEMSPHGHTASVKPMHLDRIPIQEFAEIQPKHRILKVGQGHSCPLGHSTLGCVDSLGWEPQYLRLCGLFGLGFARLEREGSFP